jgi:hypothetical protein
MNTLLHEQVVQSQSRFPLFSNWVHVSTDFMLWEAFVHLEFLLLIEFRAELPCGTKNLSTPFISNEMYFVSVNIYPCHRLSSKSNYPQQLSSELVLSSRCIEKHSEPKKEAFRLSLVIIH